MEVNKHDQGFYVLDGANKKQREWLRDNLMTEVRFEGERTFFKPTPQVCEFFSTLRGVRFEAPFPSSALINRDYLFAHKREPYDHQRDILPHIRELEAYGLLWDVGLGKSKAALDWAAQLFLDGKINAVLVITLKGVHSNWIEKEIPEHLCLPALTAAWPFKRGVDERLLSHNGLAVAAINFDVVFRTKGLAFIKRFLTMRKVLLIVDESHNCGTPDAMRTATLIKLAPHAKKRLILTGTFIPNSPLAAYSQMLILDKDIWKGATFQTFKRRYTHTKVLPGVTVKKKLPGGREIEIPVKVITGYKNLDELKAICAPYTSRLTKDILKLPPVMYHQQVFDMSDEQKTAYHQFAKEKILQVDASQMTAQLAITAMMRLQQISCGFWTADDHTIHRFDANPRLDALSNLLEQLSGKAIIWATFNDSISLIEEFLKERYPGKYVVYTGATSSDDRTAHVRRFQNDQDCLWFLGNPYVGGTGITLTAATDAIYWNNSYRLDTRLQSEGRPHRIGQTGTVTYSDLIARGTLDRTILLALQNKLDVASQVTGDELKAWLRSL